jgi:hypothetical protein
MHALAHERALGRIAQVLGQVVARWPSAQLLPRKRLGRERHHRGLGAAHSETSLPPSAVDLTRSRSTHNRTDLTPAIGTLLHLPTIRRVRTVGRSMSDVGISADRA